MGFRAIRILIGSAVGLTVLPHLISAQEVIFVVRHSDPPSTLNLDEILDETPLSESGQKRAKLLAERLKDAGITAIYATKPSAQSRRLSLSQKLSDFKFVFTRMRTPMA